MSIITERLLSQINEETLNERTTSRAEDEQGSANDAEATPSSTKPSSELAKIRAANQSKIVGNLIKNAYIYENEIFSNIKGAIKDYVEQIKQTNSANKISDDDAIEEFKRINAAFLYQTGWDLFPRTGNFRNLSLAPDSDKIKEEVPKFLPKGKNWNAKESNTVYTNRKDKNTTLIYYWNLIYSKPTTIIDEPYMILDDNGLRVVMTVTDESGSKVSGAGNLKGGGLQNLPTDKNNLKLIDLINIAKAWDNFSEEDLRTRIKATAAGAPSKNNQKDTKVASKGANNKRRRTSPSGQTVAPTYNIRKAPRDGWISGYQVKLKSFYDKNAATNAIAEKYKGGKLTDGRYGYRTHYVTIKAADNIINQLNKFLNPNAAAPATPAATPAPTNERRIKQLSKLLETKLVGSELNLFNEQDTPPSDAEKRKELQALLTELSQIKQRLETAHSQDSRPTSDASVDGKDLARFNQILSMLSWNENGEIDFNEVYKKMGSAAAAKGEPATEKEKVAQVARTIRGTCWFDFDPNTGGIRSGTPIAIWAAAGADFEEWYKKIVELFNYEGASSQFNYKSGAAAQGRLRGAPDKLNDNKTQSISLDCLSVFMTKIADNFRRNGVEIAIPQFVAAGKDEAKKKAVLTGAKYFLTEKGTYEGSVAHGLEQILNKVIAIIPSFKRGQIQKAMETLVSKASDEAKKAARETIARARRNEKAVTANAQKAQARAAAKPAAPAVAAKGTPAAPAAAGAAIGTSKNPMTDRQFQQVKNLKEKLKNKTVYVNAAGRITKYTFNDQGEMASSGLVRLSPQQESLKQRREKLLNEAIFKKLVI